MTPRQAGKYGYDIPSQGASGTADEAASAGARGRPRSPATRASSSRSSTHRLDGRAHPAKVGWRPGPTDPASGSGVCSSVPRCCCSRVCGAAPRRGHAPGARNSRSASGSEARARCGMIVFGELAARPGRLRDVVRGGPAEPDPQQRTDDRDDHHEDDPRELRQPVDRLRRRGTMSMSARISTARGSDQTQMGHVFLPLGVGLPPRGSFPFSAERVSSV